MGSAGTIDAALLDPAAPLVLTPSDFALFVLSVGDGDSLILRFPDDGEGPSFAVVDCFDAPKTIALLQELGATRLRFVCASHPHFDHIRGLRDVVRAFAGQVGEFWDSGFRFTSATYEALIEEVERQRIRFIRPTSGYEVYVGLVRITVLSPSIALRNRYDTYGVDVNNASIVLRVSYPERAPSTDYPRPSGVAARLALPRLPTRTVILGGDAQTDAWGRVLDEFPHSAPEKTNWSQAISARTGRQPLGCDLFKVSHHGSKRGINFELLERLGDKTGSAISDGPDVLVVSSATDAESDYGFPHLLTQEILREVREPMAAKIPPGQRKSDGHLGIHNTAQTIVAGGAMAGSIGFTAAADGRRALYRFADNRLDRVDLSVARKVNNLR